MGLAVFKVNGVDFSDCVKRGGMKWTRHDLDKDGSGRSLDTYMHRHRLGQKKIFYGTELSGGVWGVLNRVLYWDAIDFDLTEV